MNTPAHLILNVALATGGGRTELARPALLGALLPDLPMFLFFLWERGVAGTPDAILWNEIYFQAGWQDFFDVFNSIPLALLGLALAHRARSRAGLALFASMLLHHGFDLALHHDDAHRHFLPFSDLRVTSPVSYWDPRHHGAWAALGELGIVTAGAVVLARRYGSAWLRALLAACVLLQAWGWLAFYRLGLFGPDF